MNIDQQDLSSVGNSLLFTATIYTQDMSQANNAQQNLMSIQNRQQQQNTNESSQILMSDLNPFMGGTGMDLATQQQTQQASSSSSSSSGNSMMNSVDEAKDSYRGKFSRSWKAQLP
jgi:hypothetical protein